MNPYRAEQRDGEWCVINPQGVTLPIAFTRESAAECVKRQNHLLPHATTFLLEWAPAKDERPAMGLWAPGNYMNLCPNCYGMFIGDKRAGRCADCAYRTGPLYAPFKKGAL